jgi:hypothetical protein
MFGVPNLPQQSLKSSAIQYTSVPIRLNTRLPLEGDVDPGLENYADVVANVAAVPGTMLRIR